MISLNDGMGEGGEPQWEVASEAQMNQVIGSLQRLQRKHSNLKLLFVVDFGHENFVQTNAPHEKRTEANLHKVRDVMESFFK